MTKDDGRQKYPQIRRRPLRLEGGYRTDWKAAIAQAGWRLSLDSRRKELAHVLGRDRRGGELALADHRIEERGL